MIQCFFNIALSLALFARALFDYYFQHPSKEGTIASMTRQYQLLQIITLNLNSSVLIAQLGNIFQYLLSSAVRKLDFSVFAQLSWAKTGKYKPSCQSNTEN